MPLKVSSDLPYPSLKTSLRAPVSSIWDCAKSLWAISESPVCAHTSDEEYLRHARNYDPSRRAIDEAWARFIEEDDEVREAIGCPKGFMYANLQNEIRYNEMELGALELGGGILLAIHTTRACCYGWNGIVQERVVRLVETTTDRGTRMWLRLCFADASQQEAISKARGLAYRDRTDRQLESLLTQVEHKLKTEEDLRDVENLLAHARNSDSPPALTL